LFVPSEYIQIAIAARSTPWWRVDASESAEATVLAARPEPVQIVRMANHARLATIAACAGDPARANILSMLMDGRAFTAGELSAAAGVTPQTASGHLTRMVDAGLLAVAQQGRHRYYRLASSQVAQMLEGMMVVAAADPAVRRFGPRDRAMRFARNCYDHLAGQLAVALADRLVEEGYLVLADDGGAITSSGRAFFSRLGFDLNVQPHRAFCRPCLDWSERRYHLAGTLGTRFKSSFFEQGWIRQRSGSRAVELTTLGRGKFRDVYGLNVDA
jgi:DNA-binding transcriptional ArsR family regulator